MLEVLALDFAYGEHGVYVWSAWGLSILIMLVMAASPSLRWRMFRRKADRVRISEEGED